MDINSFQRESWNKFFSRDIYDLFDEFAFDYKGIHIRMQVNPSELLATGRRYLNYGETVSGKLKADFTIMSDNEQDTAACKQLRDVTLMEIPILTDTGFIKGGTKYGIVSNLSPASGWYVESKKGAVRSRLKNSAVEKLSIYRETKTGRLMIGFRNEIKGEQRVSVFVFLKALTAKNFEDILTDFRNIDIALQSYMSELDSSVEPSAIECANRVLALIGDKTQHKDPVEILRLRIFKSIIYRVGKEKIRRFENSQSFLKAVGLTLAKSVTCAGKYFEEGSVITRQLAIEMDQADISEITVNTKDGMNTYDLYKIKVEESLTYEELVAAVYNYILYLDGIGSSDSQDNYCNKILTPVGSYCYNLIENYLDTLEIRLTNKINSNDYYIDTLIDENLLRNLDPTKEVEDSLNTSSQFQMLDEMNSITVFEQEFRVSCDARHVVQSARDVQKSQYGRICPYTTAESDRVGLNTSLSVMANVDSDGFVTTPVKKVVDGKVSDEMVWISNIEERGRIIAPYEVDLNSCSEDEIIRGCSLNGDQVDVNLSEVSYQLVSPAQINGPLLSYVPFSNHNAGKRLIMGVNTLKQAMPVVNKERPWVSTGVEAIMPIGIIRGRDIIKNALQSNGYFDEPVDASAKLTLKRIGEINDLVAVFSTDHKLIGVNKDTGKPKELTYVVPSMAASVKKTPVRYCLKSNDDKVYGMDDIVFYSSDVSADETYKIDEAAFKESKIQASPKELENRGLALGNNVKVLFTSWEGYGYEDSIIINETFANQFGLSTVSLTTKKCAAEDNQMFTNRISDNSINASYLDVNGLPRPGTHLRVGEIVIGKVTLKETTGGIKQINSCEKIETGEDGVVIHASIQNNSKGQREAVVVIGALLKASPGDKLSGMHGNKGVIGIVVPAEQLPFTEDNEIPDLVINPLGVISRGNVGQCVEIIESQLGRTKGEIQIAPPFSKLNVGELLSEAAKYGVVEKDIYDPRTGAKFPKKAFIGTMYMLRSLHTSTSKYNATGVCLDNVNQRTGQPNRGRGGGQRISEMATWCYNSYGASNVLDALFTVQSDDSAAKHVLNRSIKAGRFAPEVEVHSQNSGMLEAYFRPLGANIVADGNDSWLEPINSERARELAAGVLNLELEPKDVLRDPKIFGIESSYVKHIQENRNRYGALPLGCEVIMPIMLSSRFLEMFICRKYKNNEEFEDVFLTKPKLEDIIGKRVFFRFNDPSGLPVLEKSPVVQKNDIDFESHTGICGLVKMVKQYDLNKTLEIVNTRLGYTEGMDESAWLSNLDTTNKSVEKDLEIRASVMIFMQNNSLDDFITDTVLVPPIVYRPKYKDNTTTALDDQIFRVLTQALNIRKWSKDNCSYYTAYNYMFILLRDMLMENKSSQKKTIWQELTDHTTKHSVIRDTAISKRVGYSGRSVICVDSKLHINEAGIPVSICVDIMSAHIVKMILDDKNSKLHKLRYISTVSEDIAKEIKRMLVMLANENISGFRKYIPESDTPLFEFLEDCRQALIDIINKLSKMYPEILSREPCLHKFSCMGFNCVPVWGYAIHLHPLACPAFNADFDGDQMSVTIPQTASAIQEVRSKMMQSQNLVNPKDASPIMDLNQDMTLGMYCATKPSKTDAIEYSISVDDIGDYYVGMKNASLMELWNLIESKELSETSMIYCKVGDHVYKNTCGRILFNSLFPGKFGFTDEQESGVYKLMYEDLIKSKQLKKITGKLISEFDEQECIETLDRLKDFGFYFADMSGITLSFYDFAKVPHAAVDAHIEEANDVVKEINQYYECGFLTENEKHTQIVDLWNNVKKDSTGLLMKEVDPDSNIFAIVDSGSRGSPTNLCEIMGIVGTVINAKNEVLEAPIRSSYLEGLNPIESFSNSYNARRVTVATQLTSSDAGEKTREFIYLVEHLQIQNAGTHCDSAPTAIPMEYELKCSDIGSKKFAFENVPAGLFDDARMAKWNELKAMVKKLGLSSTLNDQTRIFLVDNDFTKIPVCDDEGNVAVVDLQYKLTELSRNLLWLRSFEISKVPEEMQPQFKRSSEIANSYIVSEDTIDLIEQNRYKEFYIYTILGCSSDDHICKRCYGLKYDTRQFPKDMETVGYQAAQAIGEPTSQLILDTHKKSTSGVNGLAIVDKLLRDARSANPEHTVAMDDAMVIIESIPTGYRLTCGDIVYDAPDLKDIHVCDGMHVSRGTVLYGKPNYADLLKCKEYDKARVNLWKEYLEAYNMGILARNFELIVRAQSEYGVAEETKLSEGIISGETYYTAKLAEAGVKYEPSIVGMMTCMERGEKVFASIAKGFGKEKIGTFTLFRTKNRHNSTISGAVLGVLKSKNEKLKFGEPSDLTKSSKQEASHVLETKVMASPEVKNAKSIFASLKKTIPEETTDEFSNMDEQKNPVSVAADVETTGFFD